MKQADEFRQNKRATLWVVSVGLLIIMPDEGAVKTATAANWTAVACLDSGKT